MKKKSLLLICVLLCAALLAAVLIACNGNEGTKTGGQTTGGEDIEPARLIFEKSPNGCSVTGYEGVPTVVAIPETYEGLPVTSIGQDAFAGCTGLISVTIPDSVTSMGDHTFRDCSKLTSVAFEGTKAEWNNITKGTDWNESCPFAAVVCSDGTIPYKR